MRYSTGMKAFDILLDGGIEDDTITMIYGPAGSGKTNICLHCSIECISNGKKVIYIDTEGGFSKDRLNQLEGYNEQILENMFFLRPTNFLHQKESFTKLRDMVDDKVGLIVVDTIAMLYRIEIGKSEKLYDLNRELGRQISLLAEIARKKKIPILIANQVYAAMDNKDCVVMVGGDLLRYQSKCLVELQSLKGKRRVATVIKHRSIEEGKKTYFEIKEKGIVMLNP